MNLEQTMRYHASADFMSPGAIAVPMYKARKKKRLKAATVKRINNPAPVDGPEIYELHDEQGNISKQYRDRAGAENAKRQQDRKRYGMKEYPALKYARRFRDGKVLILDNRQRYTTGGSGGTGGGGPSNG